MNMTFDEYKAIGASDDMAQALSVSDAAWSDFVTLVGRAVLQAELKHWETNVMTDDITGMDARRALNGNDDASQHRDDLLKLEFLRLVEALGIDRAERLIQNMRETLNLSPGTPGDPRR